MTLYPHQNKLLIGIPFSGRPIPIDVMLSWHALAYPMNYAHMFMQVRGQPVDKAREAFAEQALAENCKYIFFWDEDVMPPSQAVPELIYRMEHTPDAAVVGGVYCLKREPPEPLVFRGNGNGPSWDWKAGEYFECSGVGMGCTVIRVECLKDLKKPWFKTEFDYSRAMDGQGGVESWSEDLWFCDRVTKTNKWKVYCDATIICEHMDFATEKKYSLPPDSKPVQHMPFAVGKKKIVDLGSGPFPYQCKDGSIVRVDIEKYKPDYRCDLRKLPFEHKTFDVVFSPALEHYEKHEANDLIEEWLRIMKDDGQLRLVVTDITHVAKEITAGVRDPNSLYHERRRSFWTLDSINEELKRHSLKVEKVPSDASHIAIRATREKNGAE
jgi:predicted SAM-dependent methyltransferase